jgi:hypothetical protein
MSVAQYVTLIFFVNIFRFLCLYMDYLLYICNIFVTRLN